MSVLGRARLLALSSHPGPTVAVTTLSIILGVAIGLDAWRVVLVGLAILAGQLSIGLSNDWIDARRDTAVGRTDKPIASGAIPASTVRNAAFVTAALAVALSFALSVGTGIAHTILIASGWAYNAGLKRTAFSLVPFLVSFGLLPSVVTLASAEPSAAAWWATATGAVLGIPIHFTNVLPDLDDDARTGVSGLPHRLGRRATGTIAFVALVVGAAFVMLGPVIDAGFATGPSVLAVAGFVIVSAIAVIGIVLVLTRPPSRLLFQLIIVSALVLVAQLALSGGTILAAAS
jgi:4-hydroxybenzoate polyprenyltransferase